MHLVIGAAGFAGRHAVTALGDHVRVRTAEPGDDLEAAMVGVDVVYLAHELRSPFERHPRRARQQPHPLLTRTVRVARLAGVRRLVLLSSAASVGFSREGRVSERTRPRPEHPYERALGADEAWLLDQFEPEPVVVRAATPFGPGEPVLERLLAALAAGRLWLPAGGRAERSFLAGPDLGRALLAAGARAQPNVAYLFAGPRGSWRGLLDVAGDLLGLGAPPRRVPYDLAYLAAVGGWAARIGGGETWPTPFAVDLLARGHVVEDGWSRRELGWEPQVVTLGAGLGGVDQRAAGTVPLPAPATSPPGR